MGIPDFYFFMRRCVKAEAIILLFIVPAYAHAGIAMEEDVANCLKVSEYSAEGERYYKLKLYAKAREQYERQVGWSESCQLDEDKIAMAYNNVALTYAREGNYLKARAWLSILPEDKKSIFNFGKFRGDVKKTVEKLSAKSEAQYWQYAGASLWNTMTIKPQGQKYKIDFQGYYAGLMTMYYGPNMGEFSTVLEVNKGKAQYVMSGDDEGNCVYDFVIEKDLITVKRTAGDWCGFGHNVGAEGIYHRVEF